MFRSSKTAGIKQSAVDASEFALELARDKRFRKRLLSALEHGSEAGRRARRGLALETAIRQVAQDHRLLSELRNARKDLAQARGRVESKRSGHRGRTVALLVAMLSLAAVPAIRMLRGRDRAPHSASTGTLENLTKDELYTRAQEAEIPGRSDMSKEQLTDALRALA